MENNNIVNQETSTKSIIDIPFLDKHIKFENLNAEQIDCLLKLSEFYMTRTVRRSAVIAEEEPKQETLEEAARNYAININKKMSHKEAYEKCSKKDFIAGAKKQLEQIIKLLKDNDYDDESVFELIEEEFKRIS